MRLRSAESARMRAIQAHGIQTLPKAARKPSAKPARGEHAGFGEGTIPPR